jgi:hypothetical protein
MEQFKKIIGINLAILLIYTVIIQFIAHSQADQGHNPLVLLILTMYALIAHVGVNLLISIFYFFKGNNDKGKAFILSTIITLLVGFSACLGSTFLG